MSRRHCLVALLTFANIAAAPALPPEVLVLPGSGRGGREAFALDPVQAAIVAGTWQPPKAGDELAGRRWVKAPLKNGTPDLPAANGGYVYCPVTVEADASAVLEAAGHGMVYVNGEPRAGDVYRNGYVRTPIHLKAGVNHLLFAPGRGAVSIKLSEATAPATFNLGDLTVPDFAVGEAVDAEAAIVVLNHRPQVQTQLVIEARLPGGEPVRTPVPDLLPQSFRKVGFRLTGPAPTAPGPVNVQLRLLSTTTLDEQTLKLNAVTPTAARKRTFRSSIDGSVQYYGWVPAAPAAPETGPARKPGLVLTLHGASVEGIGQAACYAPKPGLHVVAPTNRRPYGFDWEDWGRLDALEVLERTQREFGTDPARTYLTGHSMGGHGTWHLGVTYPDRFAAIAPSAGWVSFWSYAGSRRDATPPPEREPFQRAMGASDTLALSRNLSKTGVYVLHGDADDNVPVAQARTMRQELAGFHGNFAYYEQPGAGHWWGNACVDWPPLFEYLARHQLPERATVKRVEFRTAHPGVSADCHWLTIETQRKPFAVSRVDVSYEAAKSAFRGTTENVARLSLDLKHLPPATKQVSVTLDGQTVELPLAPRVWLERSGDKWVAVSKPDSAKKGPHRSGAFKDAFRERMVFVYGTHGTPAENAWAFAKARFDAEQFWYRGNGSVDVIADTAFDAKAEPERSVILYGHADMNAAWQPLLGPAAVLVQRGELRIDERTVKGDDLACLFTFPRPNSERGRVAVIAGTGMSGLRLTERVPYFSSGVGYPDWSVFDPRGVRAAGFFNNDWGVWPAESAWRE